MVARAVRDREAVGSNPAISTKLQKENKMKKISLNKAEEIKNSDSCIATEYDFKDRDIDISTAVIKGRYPEKGFCVNTQVKEIIFVIDGRGEIFKGNERISFQKGDAILIDKNEKYFWNADCKVVMSCSPAWHIEQHKIIF